MKLLEKCIAQYANNLLASKELVLRTDRDRGDNPFIEFYSDEADQKLIIIILNTVYIEDMTSDPALGAKNRTDIHFSISQLDDIIDILSPFIDSLSITFDDTPRSTPDPTGMEYPNGLPLGETKTITWIPARMIVNYADKDFSIEATKVKVYIDVEKYKKENKIRKKFHLGANMGTTILKKADSVNNFELLIDYSQLKRFLYSMKVAKMWFKI